MNALSKWNSSIFDNIQQGIEMIQHRFCV